MAHSNAILAQVLKLVTRHEFETLAKQHHSGRSFRTASRWTQFTGLVMAQLSGHSGLRDIVENLAAQAHRLYRQGSGLLSRSTLLRMNEEKPYELYEALFGTLLMRCQQHMPGHEFKFKNALYSLDASTIDLCLSVFPWADFRTKGAIKLHVGLNHAGYLPEFVQITEGNRHEVNIGKLLNFPKGSIVAMDRDYTDYSWYKALNGKGIYFVTRLKRNADYVVIKRKTVNKSQELTSDQVIRFTGIQKSKDCPIPLRRIGYRDPETSKHDVFLTNNMKLSAKTIADTYKSRWQIGLFFKWIKQNLRIKSFIGTSKNAVMTQIWIVMCVYLILAYLKFQSKLDKNLRQILRILQLNLFKQRDLLALLRGAPPASQQVNNNQLWCCCES